MEVLGGSFNEIWAMSPQVSSYMATRATLRMSIVDALLQWPCNPCKNIQARSWSSWDL